MTSNIDRQPIVMAVDRSTSAVHAARWAADEAVSRRAPLLLVHAVNTSTPAYAGGLGYPRVSSTRWNPMAGSCWARPRRRYTKHTPNWMSTSSCRPLIRCRR
ncbi:MAG: hypothetical protein DLM61_26005 [Pseudonocardiales bacterium]|nr:MAG: hypothetical protein DLM61_26005 [Pseudonocardiales bacterium]